MTSTDRTSTPRRSPAFRTMVSSLLPAERASRVFASHLGWKRSSKPSSSAVTIHAAIQGLARRDGAEIPNAMIATSGSQRSATKVR